MTILNLEGLERLLSEALNIGLDFALREASEVHRTLAGYLPHKHMASDEDVKQMQHAVNAFPELIRRVREAEEEARRYRTIKNGYSIGLEIKCHKKRFSLAAQFTSYPYTTYPTLDEAVDAVIRQEQTK